MCINVGDSTVYIVLDVSTQYTPKNNLLQHAEFILQYY